MSYAVHVFSSEKFSDELYRQFLTKVKKLYGQWELSEESPFYNEGWIIHDCFVTSKGAGALERVNVNVAAKRWLDDELVWPFQYEWYLSVETSAGRSTLALAVQLGTLLFACRHFNWFLVIDRDIALKGEPEEFRTTEAFIEHVRRVVNEYAERRDYLHQLEIADKDGYLLLPKNL